MKRAIVEYDYIRAVAVLLVILGHCTYYKIVTLNGGIDYGINTEQSITGKILSLITLILYAFHMPLFIALSGSLWAVIIQDKGVPTFKFLIKNKANRLLLPFLFVALFWSIPLKYLSGYWHGSFQEIACQIFLGQILMSGSYNSHLWFLQALFFIFILAYFVEKFNLRSSKVAQMKTSVSSSGRVNPKMVHTWYKKNGMFVYLQHGKQNYRYDQGLSDQFLPA